MLIHNNNIIEKNNELFKYSSKKFRKIMSCQKYFNVCHGNKFFFEFTPHKEAKENDINLFNNSFMVYFIDFNEKSARFYFPEKIEFYKNDYYFTSEIDFLCVKTGEYSITCNIHDEKKMIKSITFQGINTNFESFLVKNSSKNCFFFLVYFMQIVIKETLS